MKRIIAFIICLVMVLNLTPYVAPVIAEDTTEYTTSTPVEDTNTSTGEISYGEISGVNTTGGSIKISGAPEFSTITLTNISELNYDQGIPAQQTSAMGEIVGAYDISVTYNGEEWQPNEGELVSVTTNVGEMGLFNGDEVYVIHVHKTEDGQKLYNTIGPLTVENGAVTFATESFSEYYYLRGDLSFSINREMNDTYYLEPGTTMTIVVPTGKNYTADFDNSNGSNIEFSNNLLEIASNAVSGESATIKVVYNPVGNSRDWTAIVNIVVKTRQEIVTKIVDDGHIMIAILCQSEGSFPSEPTNTSGQYYHVDDLDGDGDYTLKKESTKFHMEADKYLNADAMSNSSAWMYDVAGDQIYGIVDATGKATLAAFETKQGEQTVDWTQIAEIIAEHNDRNYGTSNDIELMYKQEISNPTTGPVIETHGIYLTTDETKTIEYYMSDKDGDGLTTIDNMPVYYAEFRLIPYVIKYMDDNTWHVDVALVRGDAYVLGYNINLGEYTLEGTQKIVLPDSHVYMECKEDEDTVIYITLDDWAYKNRELSVYHKTSRKSGTITFKGWAKTPTATESQLIQPLGELMLSEHSTTLYAIWDVSEELKTYVNTLTIYKDVLLVSDHDSHPLLPIYGTIDFVPFSFELDLMYSDVFSGVWFEANKYVPTSESTATIQLLTCSLKEIYDGTKTCDYLKINEDSISIELYDGESIRFYNMPVMQDSANTKVYEFSVTETITEADHQHHYSTQDGVSVHSQTIPAVMSVANGTVCQFYNYYTPPLAGIKLSAENGSENEAYIFRIEATKSEIFDVKTFDPISVVVPKNSSVMIKHLPVGTYKITAINAWDTLYSSLASFIEVSIMDGKEHEVKFSYSFNDNKYMFGYSYRDVDDHHIVINS